MAGDGHRQRQDFQMTAATAAARVKKGDREVPNGQRLARRAIWFLLAVGACLPALAAATRPIGPAGRGLTGAGRAASPRQVSTGDNKDENRATKAKRGSANQAKKGPTPAPAPTPKPTPRPAPPASDIYKDIRLRIIIAGDYGAPPRRINTTVWSREQDKPATEVHQASPAQQDGVYIISLTKGLSLNKDYWVTVTTADGQHGQLSGEAVVPTPVKDKDELPIRVNLYPAVTFEVSARREGGDPPGEVTVSVVEKSQKPSSAIPYGLGPDGRRSFVKGLNPEAEYDLLTDDGGRFPINPDEIKDGELRMNLSTRGPITETVIKVSTGPEGEPVRDAKVLVFFDDSQFSSKYTNEQGVATFPAAAARRVYAVEVEAPGHESFYCGRKNEAACPEPDESRTIVIPLTPSTGFGAYLLQWTTIIAFPLAAVALIVLGVAIFRILLSPLPPPAPPPAPPADSVRQTAERKAPARGATSELIETSSQAAGPGAQESSATLAQHETALTPEADGTAQPYRSPAVLAHPVPSSLSAEMAKEAYGRWVRREKLTRDPVRLDIVLGNSTDDRSLLLRETNDPGSKFILFTDGESGGWLFPNPARSVFQTEAEQTWRLVFKDLSKEEFGRKTEHLNPIAARRAEAAAGKRMWTAEPQTYEFG